jgi:hypothetical protein
MRREAAGLNLRGEAVLEAAFEHLYNGHGHHRRRLRRRPLHPALQPGLLRDDRLCGSASTPPCTRPSPAAATESSPPPEDLDG